MKVFSRKTLREFWQRHPEAKQALKSWYMEVRKENWKTPHDLTAKYPKARIVGADRAVFNIRGKQFRLVARINYQRHYVFIRFVGTHAEYDKINAKEV